MAEYGRTFACIEAFDASWANANKQPPAIVNEERTAAVDARSPVDDRPVEIPTVRFVLLTYIERV